MNSTDSRHEVVVTLPSDREIVMTRTFDASRERVFEAFTRPELIRRWLLGPDGWSMPVCEVDLRPGGSFHYVWRNDATSAQFGLSGIYREISPCERTVHVERFDDPSMPGDALVTTTFATAGEASTTVTIAVAYPTHEVRDLALESGMDRGVAASFARLATLL